LRKLLFLSYPFPPLGAAGALRPFRFAKYLPEFGWLPFVLTIRERKDVPKDYSLLKELPSSVNIIRTRMFYPAMLWDKIASLTRQRTKPKRLTVEKPRKVWVLPNSGRCSARQVTKRFLLSLISTPDHHIFWFPFAIRACTQIVKEHNISGLMTTSPPHSSHLVGLAVKKISRLPWIVDFRDPWVDNFKLREDMLPWQKRVEKKLERLIVENADAVIANTKTNMDMLIKRYPYLSQDKFITIRNGFEDISSTGRERSFNKFTITHTGIFYPMVNPYFFFEALREWLSSKGENTRRNTRVLLVGETKEGETKDVIKSLQLEDVVKFVPRLPHRKALSIARMSDLLLVSLGFDSRNAGWVPMKVYDYLGCKRPILAFLPEGEAAALIRKAKAGSVITSPDFKTTQKVLDTTYDKKLNHGRSLCNFDPETNEIDLFNVKNLTFKLASVLQSITK